MNKDQRKPSMLEQRKNTFTEKKIETGRDVWGEQKTHGRG
jgi:hypothetical protein